MMVFSTTRAPKHFLGFIDIVSAMKVACFDNKRLVKLNSDTLHKN